MGKLRLPFVFEFLLVLVACVLVVIACGQPTKGIKIDVYNNCDNNIKLCRVCDHIIPGDRDVDYLVLTEDDPKGSIEIWRQDTLLEKFNVTGNTFPENEEFLKVTITVSCEEDPLGPLFETITATSSSSSVTVAPVDFL
jgi:hypothetical protein